VGVEESSAHVVCKINKACAADLRFPRTRLKRVRTFGTFFLELQGVRRADLCCSFNLCDLCCSSSSHLTHRRAQEAL
jgi:hypothetical protein